jgi:hypothetical protein
MPSACAPGVGTYSDPVVRTTFRHQVLEFADGHRFWNVCDILYYDAAVCIEDITSFDGRRTGALFIDVLKSCWNVSRRSSLTCTATTVPRKELEGYKFQCLCPVLMALEKLILWECVG